MSKSFLTLGMAEQRPESGTFNILSMNMDDYKIVCIDLKGSQIVTPDGEIIWDIGKVTEVDGILQDDECKDIIYLVNGNAHLSDESVNLKEILEDQRIDYADFERNKKLVGCIVCPSTTLKIETDSVQSYLTFSFRNDIRDERRLLNKDFRWLNYWTYMFENKPDELEYAQNRYINLFNTPGKKLYLIMYRRKVNTGSTEWIAGMHLI